MTIRISEKTYFFLYTFILIYGALAWVIGHAFAVLTLLAGFGILVILYLALEWIITPCMAFLTGAQSRWSALHAVIGLPLFILFTFITPVVSSGQKGLYIPVPWLSFPEKYTSVFSLITLRLIWWGGLYLLGFTAGMASKYVWPVSNSYEER